MNSDFSKEEYDKWRPAIDDDENISDDHREQVGAYLLEAILAIAKARIIVDRSNEYVFFGDTLKESQKVLKRVLNQGFDQCGRNRRNERPALQGKK